ncbi:alpha/beta hydrolase [Mycolicibacterium fortuitum]|uniref:Esterase n=1 Tax=Mycolicibacterium fortuitum subsp. fortuitum DSM 46621 = ATCC 6841 = JCM 6387 TaxID=1214102 RepID=K0V9K3_MYCFO|nr:alpha/beta hydrolase [Mycolicibacterium fortuitum]EJZ07734.1 esterase [Mycolicibacterium fortuitum subsp. fortuitum DSM 46621 = ATCC 6841 = JCM 6387]WEV31526.1 alpha/beta hydrolase [Mycolicibacterium fortuitum]CRL55533.1 esterase [Mycolicibacterium fortuitum subsp. fortuitum DSM 46621 = ATCC 6841 = JCM 6387]CRL71374.1 esterase [Mycolicibacter nonchromogenicus]
MTAPSKVSRSHHAGVSPARPYRGRRFPVSDGAPVEVVEDGPSLAGRLASLAATLTIKPTLAIGSHVPHLPWPFGLVNFAARLIRPVPGTIKATIALPNCTAQLVRADGVLPADGKRSVILYLHGGAFLACGANTHSGIVTALSGYADSPVLVVDYRMVPKHSVGTAIDDCYDAYRWLRLTGYQPDQIVLAGDSAGGYLSLALAERLVDEGEMPAALVTMSPLFEIDNESRANHPNIHTDAMFPPKAFDALVELIERAAARKGEDVYEPLDHIEPGLPRTLIHASGSEALLSDARKAAHMLAAAGVPVELRIWPGQMHVFQLASPMVAEAKRSLRQIGEYIREATW